MNVPAIKISFLKKSSGFFPALLALLVLLYLAEGIIVPLIYAIIIAIALNPVVNYLTNRGFSRVLAITCTIMMLMVVLLAMIMLLTFQAGNLIETFPSLLNSFHKMLDGIERWLFANFSFSSVQVRNWFREISVSMIEASRALIGKTLINLGSVLVVLVLIPVYIFMLLLYKTFLVEFIHRLFASNSHSDVSSVLHSTKRIIQSYLVGLLLEALIVAVLNSVCLLVIGIDYAILIGVTGAILNIIPFIGGVIAVGLPILLAFAAGHPGSAALVLAGYTIIQFFDNHLIIPKVVASKVKLNPLVSLIVVILGGAMWGVPGMFISIPLTAIAKVIFDYSENFKPLAFLLGNIVPTAAFDMKEKFHLKSKIVTQT